MVPLHSDNAAALDVGVPFPAPLKRWGCGGFSLVEVVMAIGVVSFAFMSVLGLLPVGMKTFRSAINTSVSGQIFQRIVNEAQQTDFDTLVGAAPVVRYFDDQGNEAASADKAIYQVKTRILASTGLPAGAAAATNANLATITVQIANNPGNASLAMSNNLWVPGAGVSILTHATMVARSK